MVGVSPRKLAQHLLSLSVTAPLCRINVISRGGPVDRSRFLSTIPGRRDGVCARRQRLENGMIAFYRARTDRISTQTSADPNMLAKSRHSPFPRAPNEVVDV